MTQIFEGKHLIVLERDGWEYVERKKAKEAVAIVAVTDDGRLVLTEQMRKPVDKAVIDFPAGLVGDENDDDAAATARRELEEETGFVCERVELLARGPSSPGITSEIVSFYRAVGVRRKGAGGGVGGEAIVVHAIPLEELQSWLTKQEKGGKLIDLKVWGGLHFVSAHA
jgi:ADP-ribose pyrophosphatase